MKPLHAWGETIECLRRTCGSPAPDTEEGPRPCLHVCSRLFPERIKDRDAKNVTAGTVVEDLGRWESGRMRASQCASLQSRWQA